MPAGNRLVAAVIGTSNEVLKPNLSACWSSASPPSEIPTLANAVLHETSSATSSVTWPLPHCRPLSLGNVAVEPGRVILAGDGITLLVVNLPLERAAVSVTSLKVEPGG